MKWTDLFGIDPTFPDTFEPTATIIPPDDTSGLTVKWTFDDLPDLDKCEAGVTRRDEFQPCDKPAVALRNDPEDGEPYPVCAYHAHGDMVTLPDLIDTLRKGLA